MDNPCARFRLIRSAKERLRSRPPTYTQAELDKLFAACNFIELAIFKTFLFTRLRRNELRFLTHDDIDYKAVEIRVTSKEEFIPKDYEEREIPDEKSGPGFLRPHPIFATEPCHSPPDSVLNGWPNVR
jgi:integrase